jgi:hypothetical protein
MKKLDERKQEEIEEAKAKLDGADKVSIYLYSICFPYLYCDLSLEYFLINFSKNGSIFEKEAPTSFY